MNSKTSDRLLKRIGLTIMVLVIVMTLMPLTAMASSKTMKAYDKVLKEGNYVYCNSEAGIYRVNIKTGKKKVLAKRESLYEEWFPEAMKKNGSWLYCIAHGPVGGSLWRINVDSRKSKALCWADGEHYVERYMISGSKVYYTWGSGKYRVMDLNGKNKKKTKTKPLMRTKNSNVSGYKIIEKHYTKGGIEYCKSYLKTPHKKYYLGKIDSEF